MAGEPGKPAQEKEPEEPKKVKNGWLKRPLTWVAGFFAATAIAAGTAFGSGLGQKLFSTVTGSVTSSATAQPGSSNPSSRSSPAGPLVVESVAIGFFEDYSFVSPEKSPLSRTQLEALNTQRNSSSWAPAPPIAIANQELITLTVAGNSSSPVTINNMAIVKTCGPALTSGTLFYSPTEGAGPFGVEHIVFDLDKPVSIGQYGTYPGDPVPDGGNFFAKKVITLNYHEPQTLGVYVTTNQHNCTFTFNLNVATVNGQVTQTVTDNGRAFALTADGEDGPGVGAPFSSYALVYAGGAADQQNNGQFIQVNPRTYHGAGNPGSFPP